MKAKSFIYVASLIAVVASSTSAWGAESPNPPNKEEAKVAAETEVEKPAEAKAAASIIEIARRLRRVGHSWVLNERDRETFSFAITNQWQGKVCAGPAVREVGAVGLFVEHESGGFWCSWDQLPEATRQKYQAILAQAQRNSSAKVLGAVPGLKADPLVSAPIQAGHSDAFAPGTPKEK